MQPSHWFSTSAGNRPPNRRKSYCQTLFLGRIICTAIKWHDCHTPGVGLPEKLARPTKWIRRQADSGLNEGETHHLTRKHHYGLASRGSSAIIVVSRSGGSLTYDLDQSPFPAASIKLPIEDLSPAVKIECPFCNCDDRLASPVHSIEMSCGTSSLAFSKERPQFCHRRIPNDNGFKWISPWKFHLR